MLKEIKKEASSQKLKSLTLEMKIGASIRFPEGLEDATLTFGSMKSVHNLLNHGFLFLL